MHYKSRWLGPSLIWFFKGIKFVITFFWKHFHLFLTKGWNRFRRMKIFFLNYCCCFHEIFLTYFFFSMLTGRLKNKMLKMPWLQMKPPRFSYFLVCWVLALKWFVDFANEFQEYPSCAPMIKIYYSIQHVWNYLFWGQPTGNFFPKIVINSLCT